MSLHTDLVQFACTKIDPFTFGECVDGNFKPAHHRGAPSGLRLGSLSMRVRLAARSRLGCAQRESNMERAIGVGQYDRGRAKRRPQRTECSEGHPLVEGNVYAYGDGKRVCRKCALARSSATYQRGKAAAALRQVDA